MLLADFRVVQTHDSEEMRHALISVYGARSFDLLRRTASFEGCGCYCGLQNIGLSYGRYNARVELQFPESPWVRQQFCIRGSSRTQSGRMIAAVSPDHSCVIPSHSEIKIEHQEDYEQLALQIRIEALVSKLTALMGAPPTRPLEFYADAGLLVSGVARLRRLTFFIVSEIDATGAMPQPAVLEELEQALMICFLLGNRNSYTHLLERKASGVAPRQVRLAEEYIAANWNQPITVETLAAVTGVSIRSIFKSFRESRGYSPMAS